MTKQELTRLRNETSSLLVSGFCRLRFPDLSYTRRLVGDNRDYQHPEVLAGVFELSNGDRLKLKVVFRNDSAVVAGCTLTFIANEESNWRPLDEKTP